VSKPLEAHAPAPPVPRTNRVAIAALILGIIPIFGGLLGIILGFVARGQIAKSRGTQTGIGLANAGIVFGFAWIIVGVVIAAVAALG
jgi:Domain of unknown function (DUF4190)